MPPPLTVPQTMAVLRAKHPRGLVCTACSVLLTTDTDRFVSRRHHDGGFLTVTPVLTVRPAGTTPSLTEFDVKQRVRVLGLGQFICAGCRYDQAEQERVCASKSERGQKAYAAGLGRLRGDRRGEIAGLSKTDQTGDQAPKKSRSAEGLLGTQMLQPGVATAIPRNDPSTEALRSRERRKAVKEDQRAQEVQRLQNQRDRVRAHRRKLAEVARRRPVGASEAAL